MDNINYLSEKKLINVLEYLAVFMVIFYAGNASLFVRSFETWTNPVGLILPIVIIGGLGVKKGVYFNQKYILLIIGYILYTIASTIKFGEMHPRFMAINIIKITLAYMLVSSLRTRFFSIYENILFYLCLIGILFWILHNAFTEPFVSFLEMIEFSTQGEQKGSIRLNTIVFTISNYDLVKNHIADFGLFQLYRNSGFAWEPGAFSAYINIAILFNLLRTKFQLRNNIHFIVFVIALATTFSTTGYSIFLLLIIFYVYNQNFQKVVVLLPVVALFAAYIFTLPFMSKKIAETTQFNTEELVYNSLKYDIQYIPQRFESLQIDYKDFINHPIIGYGGHQEARWTKQLGADISTISGIGKIMAQFGIVGILFFLFSLYKSSSQIIRLYKAKGIIFPMLFVMMIAISYNIFSVLYLSIWLLYLPNFYKTEMLRFYLRKKLLNHSRA